MAYGSDSYVPLSLPRQLRVVTSDEVSAPSAAPEHPKPAKNVLGFDEYSALFDKQAKEEANSDLTLTQPSSEALELIWDTVWWRRIVYSSTVALTLYLLVLPFFRFLEVDLTTFILLPLTYLFNIDPSPLERLLANGIQAIAHAAEAILPRFVMQWIDAINSAPGVYVPWLILLLACLKIGSLIDRRIQDRALAAWSPRWQNMRYLWSRETARPRLIMASAATTLLVAYVSIFFLVSDKLEDDGRCRLQIRCLFRAAAEAMHKNQESDYFGFYLWFRIYLVIILAGAAVLVLWAYYKTLVASKTTEPIEDRGFLLWIAHSLRHSPPLIRAHSLFITGIVPFVFASFTVVTVLWASSQTSFFFMDSLGLLCSTPPLEFATPVDRNAPVTVQHPLNSFCGLVDVQLSPRTTYLVVPTDFEQSYRKRKLSAGAWEFMNYIPVPLRSASAWMIDAPFRRYIGQPRHILIVKNDTIGGQEIAIKSDAEITTTDDGRLYLYPNEPVIGLPFIYDWFYRNLKGSVEVTFIPKASTPAPGSVKNSSD
jgi:hypothetical protein